MKRFENKVAIVTGGSRDLGRAVSVQLAAEGAKVCVNYFGSEAAAKETAELIAQASALQKEAKEYLGMEFET